MTSWIWIYLTCFSLSSNVWIDFNYENYLVSLPNFVCFHPVYLNFLIFRIVHRQVPGKSWSCHMSIKTETSYGNISWKASIGCSLIGLTGKGKIGPLRCRLILGLFLFIFLWEQFLLCVFWKLVSFDMFFFFHDDSAGKTVSWLMRWDWAKLFSPLPSCRRYIMLASMVPSWSLPHCPQSLTGSENSIHGLRWILLCTMAVWPAGRWFSNMKCTAKIHGWVVCHGNVMV